MSDDTNTGIPNPGGRGGWLVPPWPADANFSDVVGHFLRHDPQWRAPSTAQLLAYFEAYGRALDAAPAARPAYSYQLRWRADMRGCVDRCARIYREKLATETPTCHQEPARRAVVSQDLRRTS